MRIVDRFRIGGVHARLCVAPPRGRRDCARIAFAPGATAVTRAVRVTSRGAWRLEVQLRRHRVRTQIAVGVHPAPVRRLPAVLATGDSTMQGVASFLADELADRAAVRGDVRPGASISDTDGWPDIAAAQARRLRPRVTVFSLGAAEGFPMTAPGGAVQTCCDAGWVAEYARRARGIYRTYGRGGRAGVLVLTIVAPRDPRRAAIVDAVNAAILRAAAGLPRVRVLRMDQLFSPHGYQEAIRYRGRDVDVRQPDGIHLNVAGTAIAAREAAQAVRAALRPTRAQRSAAGQAIR